MCISWRKPADGEGVVLLYRCARGASFLCVLGWPIMSLHNPAITLNWKYCTKKTCPYRFSLIPSDPPFSLTFFKIYHPLEWPRSPPPPLPPEFLVDTQVTNQVFLYSHFVQFNDFATIMLILCPFACLYFYKHVRLIRHCSYLILADKINFWCLLFTVWIIIENYSHFRHVSLKKILKGKKRKPYLIFHRETLCKFFSSRNCREGSQFFSCMRMRSLSSAPRS